MKVLEFENILSDHGRELNDKSCVLFRLELQKFEIINCHPNPTDTFTFECGLRSGEKPVICLWKNLSIEGYFVVCYDRRLRDHSSSGQKKISSFVSYLKF